MGLGSGFGLLLLVNIWIYKVIRAYVVETRQEYISRLNEVSLELEREKTKNLELDLRLRFYNNFTKYYEDREKKDN